MDERIHVRRPGLRGDTPDDRSVGATIERRDGRYGQSDPRMTGSARGY